MRWKIHEMQGVGIEGNSEHRTIVQFFRNSIAKKNSFYIFAVLPLGEVPEWSNGLAWKAGVP